jgi:hypothetical protein
LFQGAWKDPGFRCCSAPRAGKYVASFWPPWPLGSIPYCKKYTWLQHGSLTGSSRWHKSIDRSRRFTKVLLWHFPHTCEVRYSSIIAVDTCTLRLDSNLTWFKDLLRGAGRFLRRLGELPFPNAMI